MDSNKWHILPDSWKSDVDSYLLSVLSENRDRYEADDATGFKHLHRYHRCLRQAWNYHNQFFDQLNLYANHLVNGFDSENRQDIVKDIKNVNHVTGRLSGSLKAAMRYHAERLGVEPTPKAVFHEKYPRDHLKVDNKTLVDRYHGGSTELFEQRRQKPPLENVSADYIDRARQREIQHCYNVVDHPREHKRLHDLATIDNYDEYAYLYGLKGVEEHAIRNPSDITPVEPQNLQENRLYCAPSAVQTVFELLGQRPPSQQSVYEATASDFLPGVTFPKILSYLQDKPVNAELITSNNAFDDVRKRLGPRGVSAKKEYERKESQLDASRQPKETVLEYTVNGLQNNSYLIGATTHKGELHAETFLMPGDDVIEYDQLGGKHRLTEREFTNVLDNTIGTWGILIDQPTPTMSQDYQEARRFFSDLSARC